PGRREPGLASPGNPPGAAGLEGGDRLEFMPMLPRASVPPLLLAVLLLAGAAPPAGAEGPALASGQAHRVEVEPADVHPVQGPAGAEVRIDVLLNLADPQVRQLLEVVRGVQTRLRGEVRVVYRLHGGRYGASP